MARIAGTIGRIKENVAAYLPEQQVLDACRHSGHRWRERKLGPVLHLCVLQLLHGNTAIRGLRHLIRRPLNAAACCRARMQLPLAVLQRLSRQSADAINQKHGGGIGGDARGACPSRLRRLRVPRSGERCSPRPSPLRTTWRHRLPTACGWG